MNQAKKKYENLLVLHYQLCRASQNRLKDIGKQIADTLQYVVKYNLFPIDLPEDFREQLAQMCEIGSDELKLKISKDLYVFLGKMMFSFEGSNIINMEPYAKVLELNRTEFKYELGNGWGSDINISNVFEKELFFFIVNRDNISISSEGKYQDYCNKLREQPFDINTAFPVESELPDSLSETIESVFRERYNECNEYIERHYPIIKKAFHSYCKDARVYVQPKYGDAYLVMINLYEGVSSEITVYPNYVGLMYRFSNIEAVDERLCDSILTGFNNSEYSRMSHVFSISGIHHELNHIFVRYASNTDLTDYLAYILRGQLKQVSIISDTEIKVDKEKYLLLFSKTPTINELLELLNKEDEKTCNIVFRSHPDDSIVEALNKEGVSFIDVMSLGRSLINNQNGEMIHWFIKERLDKIQIDDSYKEVPVGERLKKQLEQCPKGKECWHQYEKIGTEIFHYLFKNTFRNYTFEFQSSTSDGTQRRDLVVNNTYKDSSSFWQLVKSDYNSNLIIVDFKNYCEKLNSDNFYNPTKYLNSLVGNFAIVFSREGLDDTAKKVQQRLLSEKKLVLCLSDANLTDLINQKMNGQEPLDSLENMYYTMCKNQ